MDLLDKLIENPDNPRIITAERYQELKKSILTDPEFFDFLPIAYDENYIILGGNQRVKVLKEIVKENPDFEVKESWFVFAKDWDEQKKKRFIIKANLHEGVWDYRMLADKWASEPLRDWGINVTGWIDQEPLNEQEAWKNMPEFDGTPPFNAFRSLIVHFESTEDLNKFLELVNQTITDKTKYIWYPYKEKRDRRSQEVITKVDEP